MRISDWSSDVCSSDLDAAGAFHNGGNRQVVIRLQVTVDHGVELAARELGIRIAVVGEALVAARCQHPLEGCGVVGPQPPRFVEAEVPIVEPTTLPAGTGGSFAVAAGPRPTGIARTAARHGHEVGARPPPL